MKVSVIIPTYNRAELVQEAIDSVLQQSYRDFEIIVVDDGSTDDTERALQRFSSKIRYVKQPNQGVNAARNRAMDLAQGELIALLDNDDVWRPFKLDLEVSLLQAHPQAGFVFGDFYILKPDGRRLMNGLHTWFDRKPVWSDIFESSARWELNRATSAADNLPRVVAIYTGDIYHTSLFGPRVLPSASLFRRSMATNRLRFNEEDPYCGDWEFFARLSHQCGAVFVDIETAFNRSHEDAVRLTRAEGRLRIEKRAAMVKRTWMNDDEFYGRHKSEVDHELAECWSQLARLQLLAGDISAAREAASQLDEVSVAGVGSEALLYRVLAFVPGISRLLRAIRSLKRKFSLP